MTGFLNLAHRIYLRTAGGPSRWHQRYYRPSVTVVKTDSRVFFEEAGLVIEAYPAEAFSKRFSGRCNILLAGPSAKNIQDKSALTKAGLMCVSGSPQLFGESIPEMLMYHVNDTTFLWERLELFLSFSARAEWTLIDYRTMFELMRLAGDRIPQTKFVVFDNWAYPFNAPLGVVQQLTQPKQNGAVYCSSDLSAGLAVAGTVAYTGGQFAWLAGFESVYYYGMDLTNSGHAYQDDNPRKQALDKAYETSLKPGFELLVREAEATGCQMFNCNPNSRLPAEVMPQLETKQSLQ